MAGPTSPDPWGRNGLALCLLLAAACGGPGTPDVTGDGRVRVACWGDSNTARSWWIDGSEHDRWCEYLQARAPATWETVNCGFYGMNVAGLDLLGADGWTACVTDNTDAVVVALGTIDIGHGRTAAQLVADLVRLVEVAATAGMPAGRRRRVLVVAIPPRHDRVELNGVIADANRLLHQRMGDGLVLPPEPIGTADATHLDDAAQHARADAVWDALRP